jgi:hypothetical protein
LALSNGSHAGFSSLIDDPLTEASLRNRQAQLKKEPGKGMTKLMLLEERNGNIALNCKYARVL